MHRDHQHSPSPRNGDQGRKEWGRSGDRDHQMEAREHARQPGKALRAFGARSDEAARQIRELRARY